MERLREQSLQPAGKKNLRFRVQTKKIRTKEAVIGGIASLFFWTCVLKMLVSFIDAGKKRHEEALAELKRRKAESAKKVHQPRQKLPPVVAKKGAIVLCREK